MTSLKCEQTSSIAICYLILELKDYSVHEACPLIHLTVTLLIVNHRLPAQL